jgi:two-component system sensor histidine kinase/response regulator
MEKSDELSILDYISVFDHIEEGILVFSSESRIIAANQKAQALFGFTEVQLIGMGINRLLLSMFSEDSSAMRIEYFPVNIVISTRKILQNCIVGVKRSDKNNITWYNTKAIPLLTDSNELHKIVVHFREIEGLNQAKKNEIQVEEKFRQLIKNSFDTLVLLDGSGIQRYVSESCEKSHGYRPEELTNINVIAEMIHPDDQEKVIAEFQNLLNFTGFGGVQYRHKHKNGGWVYLEAFGSNQINNPHINAVVLNVRDITERKVAEQKLKENEAHLFELNATKDKFFSIIAHDLTGPFHSIIGFSDLMADQISRQDYEGLERYISIIQNSAQMALDLLRNLLEWSRTQTGKVEFNPEYFELVKLISDVRKLISGSAEQKSISIFLELPHNLPVFADKAMISTVLRNLISNGIKFTNPGGKIVIYTEQENDQLIISVADNGVGIKPEAIDKLFKIEESYSTVGTRNEKGTGLGLLLCKEFIEKHDGELKVESAEGKGSIFRFSIPQLQLNG